MTEQEAQAEAERAEFMTEVEVERARQVEKGYTAVHDDEHGIDHLLTWAIEYAFLGESVKSAALIQAAREAYVREAYYRELRVVEAAPSDTDLDALTLIARDVHLYDGGPNQALLGSDARRIAEAAITAGFSRSQPVQVEVTNEMVERAAKAAWEALLLSDEAWASWGGTSEVDREDARAQMRAALSALGGGDHE